MVRKLTVKMPMDTVPLEQQQAKLAEEVLRAIGEQVVAGLTFDQTVCLMCRRLVESIHYPLIWIGTKEADGAIKVRAFGGELGHLVGNYQEYWKEKPENQGAAAKAIQNNAVQAFNEKGPIQFWPKSLRQGRGIQSGLVIPLAVQDQVLGALSVYAYSNQTFEPPVIHNLERLAHQLSLGLLLARDYDYLRLQGTAVSSARQAVCIANPDGCIEWVNEAYCRLTGNEVGEVIGASLPSFPSAEIGSRLKKRKPTLRPGQFWRSELVKTHKDGSVQTVEQNLTPFLDEQGLVKNFVSVLQDITARKKHESQMDYRAHHDPLTHLPNRVLFQDRLNQALARARRHGGVVAIVFLDLDRFKQMNDEFGHGMGDKILKTVGARLNECVRATDTVARLSGDEFTVILQDVQRVQDVNRVAQKILGRLERRVVLDGQTISMKTSMGIALYPIDGTNPDVLLKCADQAMYKAKGLGGQCCWFASEELNLQFAQQAGALSKSSRH